MRQSQPIKGMEAARSLCDQAAQHFERADYLAARSLYEQALAICEEASAELHPDTARCLNGLGQVLMRQGEYDLAQSLVERGLAIREQVLGAKHADTAESLHTLGELKSDRGELDEGRALTERALKLRERALGSKHPDTVESMKNLALNYARQGDRKRAERLLTKALPVCERALGENHLTTARVLNGLGLVWAAEECTYPQARRMYERALVIHEQLLGPDHPYTALSLNNLAALLADMGEHAAALPLLERSLAVHERLYGGNDWRTSFVLINLAELHRRQGDNAAARPLLERALIIRERTWGGQHPATLTSLRKLIAVLDALHKEGDQRAMLEAMPLHNCLVALEAAGKLDPATGGMPGAHQDPEKAAEQLHRWVEKLGAELERPALSQAERAELRVARDMQKQADALYERGDYAACQARLEGALVLQERILGAHHLDHVELLDKLARTKEKLGQYSAVLPLLRRVAEIHVEVLGPEHPATLLPLTRLASQYGYEYGPTAGMPLYEDIVKLQQEVLGPDDPLVQMARESLGLMWAGREQSRDEEEPPHQSLSERREQALTAVPPDRELLLAGIDDIDWHSLRHAYGPADDLPHLMRLLLSHDKDVRDEAWQELWSSICHQGDVYEATSYAVPFLIRLLATDAIEDKVESLWLLQGIATGQPWLSEEHTWMKQVLGEQGRDFEAETESAQIYVRNAHEALRAGLDTYLTCLDDQDPDIRKAASDLLRVLPE